MGSFSTTGLFPYKPVAVVADLSTFPNCVMPFPPDLQPLVELMGLMFSFPAPGAGVPRDDGEPGHVSEGLGPQHTQ